MKRYLVVLLRRNAESEKKGAMTWMGMKRIQKRFCTMFQNEVMAEDMQVYKNGCCIWNLVPAQVMTEAQLAKGGQQ